MIKAAFFDVDGTLLSHKTKQIPPSAIRALEILKAKGIPCIISTGRQIHQMDLLPMGGVTFDGYITMNGQLTMDKNRQPLYAKPLRGEVLEFALKLFREKKVPVIFVEQDTLYVNEDGPLVRSVQESISSKLPPVGEYTGGNVYQACVYINDQETAMLDPVRGKCVITRWHPNAVDIIAPDGGKRAAVEQYCRDNGWAREEIIAFGDSDNDLEMIRYAGIGVALGNAEPEVKAAADYVTADIDDDGLAKALEHFGLI